MKGILDFLLSVIMGFNTGGGNAVKGYENVTPTEMPVPTQTPTPTPVPDEYEARTMPTFDNYQIPREVAYGMASAEGGSLGKNNVFNLGAYDSNPQNALDYGTLEAAATAAAKLLSGQYQRSNGQRDERYDEAYSKRIDPEEMLRLIVQAGFAGDPATWKERSAKQGGAGTIFDTYDQFVKATPSWKKWRGNY